MTPVHVGLVLDYDLHYCRCVLRGIKDYALAKAGWVFLSVVADPKAVEALHGRPLDGVIAQVYTRPLAKAVAALKRPLVNVSRALFDLPFPRVGVVESQVGQFAVHLVIIGAEQGHVLRHKGAAETMFHGLSQGRGARGRNSVPFTSPAGGAAAP